MPRAARLHLLKLCVGADGVADLLDWQAERMRQARAAGVDDRPRHVTRSWPRRADELLAGGSLYWVFKGLVLARQRIVAFEPADEGRDDGPPRCAIVLAPEAIRTEAQPRRPFQGWRYLSEADAPRDLADAAGALSLPPPLDAALTDLGVIERRSRCG